MNVSGFELQHSAKSTFCQNAYCSSVIPICFAGVSPTCSRNRSFTGWCHFSFGEHVCNECIRFLKMSNSKSKISATHCIWRHRLISSQRLWMQMSSSVGKRRPISEEEFVAGNLLPWWIQCISCGSWRQVTAHTAVGSIESPYHPSRFTCGLVSQDPSDPCSWPLDDRAVLVRSRPQDFLASMQIHASLQGSPTLSLLSSFGVDLCGLSPDLLTGIGEGKMRADNENSPHTIVDSQGPFSLLDIMSWERAVFPEMTRHTTFYLAARNLVLYLWATDPKRFLTTKLVVNYCFVRGLLRIVLCEHWIPHLIEEFTYRGIINLGVCIPPELPLSDGPRGEDLRGEPLLVTSNSEGEVELRVRIVGNLNLAAAVTTRQVINGLLTRVHRSGYGVQSKNCRKFSVYFQMTTVARVVPSVDISGALGELRILLVTDAPANTKGSSPALGDIPETLGDSHPCNPASSHFPEEWHPVSVNNNGQNPSDLFPERLVLPLNMWSDRVYIHPNHPLHFMTSQTDLSLRPLSRCPLFYSDVSGEEPVSRLRLVPDEISLRMQFHVEAVLDMVAQFGEQQHTHNKMSVTGDYHSASVQECWDRQDAEVRTRVTDLTRSNLERQLIEFFLAEVECDLTEPLVTNNPYHFLGRSGFDGMHSWSYPTARLDLLPSCRYAEFTMDDENGAASCNSTGSGNRDDSIPGKPQILTPKSPNEGAVSSLCALLLPKECFTSCEVVRVTVSRDFSDSVENSYVCDDTNRSTCLFSTPRVDQTPSNVTSCEAAPSASEPNEKWITVRNVLGQSDSSNWVVLTCPTGQLRLNFCDISLEGIYQDRPAIPGALVLDLPMSLKSHLILDDCGACVMEPSKLCHELSGEPLEPATADPARLITVVLIYPTPWWRPTLSSLVKRAESADTVTTGDCSPSRMDWFAILPSCREDRGFCHNFRDLFPELSHPGVLQTQIFGAAADHWWSKGDMLLSTSVHRYLQSRLVSDQTSSPVCEGDPDDCPKIPGPIHTHVSRMQHAPRRNGEINSYSVSTDVPSSSSSLIMMDYHGQVVRLHPNAWEELARRAHVLIPDLFPSSAAGLTESSGFHGLTEIVQLSRSPGMDVLTSSVLDGLRSAELALRCIPGLGSGSVLNYPSFQSKFDSNVVDSSIFLSDCSQTDDSQSTIAGGPGPSGVEVLSARAKRLLRRMHRDSEEGSMLEALQTSL